MLPYCERPCNGCRIAELDTHEAQSNTRKLVSKVFGAYHSNQILDAMAARHPGRGIRFLGVEQLIEDANEEYGKQIDTNEVQVEAAAHSIVRIMTDNCPTQPQ